MDAEGPPEGARLRTVAGARLAVELGWEEQATVLLAYQGGFIYLGDCSWIQQSLQSQWLNIDNVVLCIDGSKWAAVYWEDSGAYCVSRGKRRLLTDAT
jgi:hypothetical protein